jgi:hypothetical protein
MVVSLVIERAGEKDPNDTRFQMSKPLSGQNFKPLGVHRLIAAALIVCCLRCCADTNAWRGGFAIQSCFAEALGPGNSFQGPSDEAVKQIPLGVLMHLAADEVNTENTFLSRTRFEMNGKEGTFFFDLSPAPRRAVLSETDRYAVALEALIRVESLKRDFQKALPNDGFWVKPLDSVQGAVKRCVENIAASNQDADSTKTQRGCSANIEEQFQNLDTSVQTYAGKHKLVAKGPPADRDPTMGYRVQVKIDPPRARVKIMTALEYKKCLALKAPLENQWNDLLDGDNEMIGRYHYLAEWPTDLNGPEEGNFEIRKPTTLTFRPRQK